MSSLTSISARSFLSSLPLAVRESLFDELLAYAAVSRPVQDGKQLLDHIQAKLFPEGRSLEPVRHYDYILFRTGYLHRFPEEAIIGLYGAYDEIMIDGFELSEGEANVADMLWIGPNKKVFSDEITPEIVERGQGFDMTPDALGITLREHPDYQQDHAFLEQHLPFYLDTTIAFKLPPPTEERSYDHLISQLVVNINNSLIYLNYCGGITERGQLKEYYFERDGHMICILVVEHDTGSG